jgi:DNA polymerase delta subunit 1
MKDYKLNSYKLDSVAEEFLKGKVISRNDNILEVDKTDDLRLNGYIKFIDSEEELVEDGKKFKIINIDGTNITLDKIPMTSDSKLSWTLAKDDVKPHDIFRLQKGDSKDRKIIAEYCIQDCALVNKLMARLCVVINNIGMANVCTVPLSFLFFRGQGIKIFSLVAKECREMNYLIPVIKKDENETNVGYEGATVFVPTVGFYKRPIAVLDYASLYPSSMIHKNLSHETFVDNDKYNNHSDYIYYDCKYKNADGTFTECRYAKKKDGEMGVMPSILSKLLKQRKATKKLMGKEKDNFMKSIYDGQQLAYKVTANSLYGQIGSSVSPIYFKQIAASTTSTGREMLELARDYMEQTFPRIITDLYSAFKSNDKKKLDEILKNELVEHLNNEEFLNDIREKICKIMKSCTIEPKTIYGDTDSVFIDFGIKKNGRYYEEKEALEFAIELGVIGGNFIKKKMHAPQDLEYEKTFYPFCILSKKRYVGNKYEFNPNKFKQNSMGIVLKRRDNARIVKKIVGGMVDILLNEVNVEKAVEYIKKSISDLLKGKYPLYNFVTSKTLKNDYKDRTRIAHVCLADRMRERDEGSAPQVNDRVPYVAIVVPEKKNLLQGDRIEHPDYIIEKKLRVDYLFYLTNQIKNPTVQFLELLVEDPDAIFKEAIEIETNRRKGNITIDNHFKVKSIKKLTSLSLVDKAKKPKNFSKYYLNEDQIDIDKLGYEDDEQIEIDIDTESPDENFEKTKDKNKYKKLFLDLRI